MSENESILVFLSYSSREKELAGIIKKRLEHFGVEAFLAHEDIKPTEKWKQVILDHLDRCDVFVPIVSENFKDSNWTDQETGYALSQGKMIIPIGTDKMPYGFIEDTQAVTKKDVTKLCDEVCNIIRNAFTNPYNNILIKGIEESETFSETNNLIDSIKESGPLSMGQIERLLIAFVSNNQVSGAWRVTPFIRSLLDEGVEIADPDLEMKVKKLLG